MGTSRIKSVQPNGTFEGAHGLRYKWEIELMDGSVGEVVTISEGRWNAGDEVEYEKTESQWGVKLKLQKPNMGGGNWNKGAKGGQSADVQKRIDASWSIGQAIAILGVCDSIDEETLLEYLKEMKNLSTLLLNIRNEKL